MANSVAVVMDLFDLLSETITNKVELKEVMTETLLILDENGVLDGYASELSDCRGVNGALDDALDAYYNYEADGGDGFE